MMESEGEAFGPETSSADEQVRANWQAYTGAHTTEDRQPLRQYPRERARAESVTKTSGGVVDVELRQSRADFRNSSGRGDSGGGCASRLG